jgi:conjugal transfer ATP-binding protein TraC
MNPAAALFKEFFWSNAVTKGDLRRTLRRDRFSDYLPYRKWDEKDKTYYNMDGTQGWMFECVPLVYAGTQTFTDFQGLFSAGLPDNSIIQFILYTDPDISRILDQYQRLKVRGNDIVQETTRRTMEYFQAGTRGFKQMAGIPARNARLFVAIKLPYDKNKPRNTVLGFRDNIYETLKGAGLWPNYVHPDTLIHLMSGILNDEPIREMPYDTTKTINKQIILAETPITSHWDKITIGQKHLKCQTVKRMAGNIDELAFNIITGDIWGQISDGNQITAPFMVTVNIILKNMNAALNTKTSLVINQRIAGSFAASLMEKRDEYLWASKELSNGVQFCRIQPIIWSLARSEEESRENSARIKRVWDSKGFTTHEDRGILNVLLLAALPFGLTTEEGTVEFIDRDFICHPAIATKCLPVQFDYMGSGNPHLLFLGRKGQIIPFDIFARIANNFNGLICAEPGSGKSFVTNKIAYEMWASGTKIRIIDIGGSYKKLCDVVEGNFLNFSRSSGICLNPFTHIREIKEDADEDLASVSAVVAQMAFSKSDHVPSQNEAKILDSAITAVYDDYKNDGDIDKIFYYLLDPVKNIPLFHTMKDSCEGDDCMNELIKMSRMLAFNLQAFTTDGPFGKWFNGPATLDVTTDDFLVLELEELKAQPELFNVVTLQIINYITNGVYLTKDRSIKQIIIFDEAWQFMGEGSLLATIIEGGYRKARKYGAAFWCITQSILDTEMFGRVGAVIRSNSKYKLLLQSSDIEKASKQNVIDYPPLVIELLKSVKSPKPRYSEIFCDSPAGIGVIRLSVDPFSYYLYTSDADDNKRIQDLVDQGMTYTEAIKTLAEGIVR